MKRFLFLLLLITMAAHVSAQKEIYPTTNCMGCHGQGGMGGLGPPIVKPRISLDEFKKLIREGKGMMPATSQSQMSDADIERVYEELIAKPWQPEQIPTSFKVGQLLTTQNVSKIFLVVFGFSFVMAMIGIAYWLRCAGAAHLWKPIKKFGVAKSVFVFLRALIIDGLLVASLWRTNKKRWLMHGLILYGFLGLILADILMSIYNPARGDLPLTSPLKLLPIVAGTSVLIGVLYVMRRYKTDPYIDNGLTLGRDFLFVNLLFHTTLSGFLTVAINRIGAHDWVMTIYIYHLISIALLIATAPFTRFQHAWIVPLMIGFTRLTETITASGVELGFLREPSPGRHHKSQRIALSVLESIGEDTNQPVRLRYYP